MKRILLVLTFVCLLLGCGGGGGGGGSNSISLTGRVLDVEKGGPFNPAASIQDNLTSVSASVTDGSFVLPADSTTTSVIVDSKVSGNPAFTFTFPAHSTTADLGDLWVGPQQVSMTGKIVDSSSGAGVAGATVSFAGRSALTDSTGTFTLLGVAYPTSSLASFWGISGSVSATNYFATTFSASPNSAVGGVVSLPDIPMTPTSDSNPPNTPYNIWGRISPSGAALGTVVTLLDNTNTPVRVYNVSSTGTYYFWVTPGVYTITFVNGALTSPNQTVTLTKANQVVEKDATLQ
ncbi:MAG: hypothetical protein JSS72_13215 [Armatimonadetes bacterium]|nr:hypothetical protein [Armatimonadota bacterium]